MITQQESEVKPGHRKHYLSALNIEALMAAPVSPIRSRQHYLLMPDHSLPLRLSYSPHSQMPPALHQTIPVTSPNTRGFATSPGLWIKQTMRASGPACLCKWAEVWGCRAGRQVAGDSCHTGCFRPDRWLISRRWKRGSEWNEDEWKRERARGRMCGSVPFAHQPRICLLKNHTHTHGHSLRGKLALSVRPVS